MEKGTLLYKGKAKSLFKTDDPAHLVMTFRDDISAFNGVKLDQLKQKGVINNYFNAFIMERLQQAGIHCHFIKRLNSTESLVHSLDMLPLECVIRNRVAGSLSKRLGIEEGTPLEEPLFEFFLKSDALGDPLITEDHIRAFHWATSEEITALRALTHAVNNQLQPLFAKAGYLLVDYKLEFGRLNGELYLADEITPDGCRIWDATTLEKKDKDRFRRDLGDVMASYREVATKLGVALPADS
ncbi:MAG: phosphoribosylaminoimidazolesuccinocarboxamide synthase [Gammaproteobacteria bacterium]